MASEDSGVKMPGKHIITSIVTLILEPNSTLRSRLRRYKIVKDIFQTISVLVLTLLWMPAIAVNQQIWKYPIYLTNWVYVVTYIYFSLSIFASTGGHTFAKITRPIIRILGNIAFGTSPTIPIMFWKLAAPDADGSTFNLAICMNIIPHLIMWIEYLRSRHRVRLSHVAHPCLAMIAYFHCTVIFNGSFTGSYLYIDFLDPNLDAKLTVKSLYAFIAICFAYLNFTMLWSMKNIFGKFLYPVIVSKKLTVLKHVENII